MVRYWIRFFCSSGCIDEVDGCYDNYMISVYKWIHCHRFAVCKIASYLTTICYSCIVALVNFFKARYSFGAMWFIFRKLKSSSYRSACVLIRFDHQEVAAIDTDLSFWPRALLDAFHKLYTKYKTPLLMVSCLHLLPIQYCFCRVWVVYTLYVTSIKGSRKKIRCTGFCGFHVTPPQKQVMLWSILFNVPFEET